LLGFAAAEIEMRAVHRDLGGSPRMGARAQSRPSNLLDQAACSQERQAGSFERRRSGKV